MKHILFLYYFPQSIILLANEITMEQARKVAMSFCETIRSRGGIPDFIVWDGESTTTRDGSSPHFMCLTVWIVMGL